MSRVIKARHLCRSGQRQVMMCTGWETPDAALAPFEALVLDGGGAMSVPCTAADFVALWNPRADVSGDPASAAVDPAVAAVAADAEGAAGVARAIAAGSGGDGAPVAAAVVAPPAAEATEATEATAAAAEATVATAAAAEATVAAAQEEAARILATARESAAHELEAARSAGWEDGRREGLSDAEETAKRLLAEAEAMLKQAGDEREKLLDESREGLVRLAMAVARHILGREVEERPETVADIVAQALAGARDAEEAVVLVNPGQVEAVQSRSVRFRRAAPRLRRLAVEADDALEPGGVVIKTPAGEVDARLSTQIKNAEEAAMEMLRYGA